MKILDFNDASICSAWIGGGCTLAAGLFAGVAALWAAHRAYKAATRDTRYRQYTDKKRELAYNYRMLVIINGLNNDIKCSLYTFTPHISGESTQLYAEHEKNNIGFLVHWNIDEELIITNWENHALLNENEIRLLHDLRQAFQEYKTEEGRFNKSEEDKFKEYEDKKCFNVENVNLYCKALENIDNITSELVDLLQKSLNQKKIELGKIKL